MELLHNTSDASGRGYSSAARIIWALQAAEILVESDSRRRIVSGHDFSRAASAAKIRRALAPEEMLVKTNSDLCRGSLCSQCR